MYFRARYYSPQLGQFISRDPLGYVDGMSQYRAYFVPNGMDPRGMDWVWPWDPNATWTPAFAEAATDIAGSTVTAAVVIGKFQAESYMNRHGITPPTSPRSTTK